MHVPAGRRWGFGSPGRGPGGRSGASFADGVIVGSAFVQFAGRARSGDGHRCRVRDLAGDLVAGVRRPGFYLPAPLTTAARPSQGGPASIFGRPALDQKA